MNVFSDKLDLMLEIKNIELFQYEGLQSDYKFANKMTDGVWGSKCEMNQQKVSSSQLGWK